MWWTARRHEEEKDRSGRQVLPPVSRVAHKAFFFDDEEKDRFVDLLMRVEFFCCVKVLAYCCMSNHIHVFIFLEFGMFGSGRGKKAEREKEMQKDPSELAGKYPMPQKPKSPLQRYRLTLLVINLGL